MGKKAKKAVLNMYLLDTNVVIGFLNASLPKTGMQYLNDIIDNRSCISVITKMEALGFNFESAGEQNAMEAFIYNTTMLDLENMIVDKTIELRKIIKIALPDAIIAATALTYDLTLLSRNTKDFIDVPNLKLKNPWEV